MDFDSKIQSIINPYFKLPCSKADMTKHVNAITYSLNEQFGQLTSVQVRGIIYRSLLYPQNQGTVMHRLRNTSWYKNIKTTHKMANFGEFKCGEMTGFDATYSNVKNDNIALGKIILNEMPRLLSDSVRSLNLPGNKIRPIYSDRGPDHWIKAWSILGCSVRVETLLSTVVITVTQYLSKCKIMPVSVLNVLHTLFKASPHLDVSMEEGNSCIKIKLASPYAKNGNKPTEQNVEKTDVQTNTLSDKILTMKTENGHIQSQIMRLQKRSMRLAKDIATLENAQKILNH